MMTNLMTILERKAFISSNPRIVLSSCPPPCGHFSIQESATGGLSYKVKKQDSGTLSPHPAFINFFILFRNAVQDFLLHFLNKAILFLFRKMLLLIPEGRPRILLWLPRLLLPLPLLRQSPLRLHLSPASC